MTKKWLAWGAAFVMLASPLYAADAGGGSGWAGRLVVSYDEGLACRYAIPTEIPILNKMDAYVGVAYYVKGSDSVSVQPVNFFAFKLGGDYHIIKWDKVNLSTFIEWREELVQKNSEGKVNIDQNGTMAHKRYNQWNTIFRAGLRPELFITDHLSLDYKFGAEFIHHSSDFDVNGAQSGLESKKNSYTEFGVYEGRYPALFGQQVLGFVPSVLLNFGFNIYF